MKTLFLSAIYACPSNLWNNLIRIEEATSPQEAAQTFLDALQRQGEYTLTKVEDSVFVIVPTNEFENHTEVFTIYHTRDAIYDGWFCIRTHPLESLTKKNLKARTLTEFHP